MRSYTIEGIELIHIMEFAQETGRSVQSLRYLIEKGGLVRPLKFYRDRSRLYIPKSELLGYPFTQKGTHATPTIYHYHQDEDGKWKQYVCTECTFGMGCSVRKAADEAEIPEGDK